MDQIIGALVTATTTGLSKIGPTAVVDTYETIKRLIQRKYANTELPDAVDKLEKKPDSPSRQGFLKEELESAGADKDSEILELSKQLIEALKESPKGQKAIGKYNLNIKDSKVGIVGDNAKVEGGMKF